MEDIHFEQFEVILLQSSTSSTHGLHETPGGFKMIVCPSLFTQHLSRTKDFRSRTLIADMQISDLIVGRFPLELEACMCTYKMLAGLCTCVHVRWHITQDAKRGFEPETC